MYGKIKTKVTMENQNKTCGIDIYFFRPLIIRQFFLDILCHAQKVYEKHVFYLR